jgi:hypothetical protein
MSEAKERKFKGKTATTSLAEEENTKDNVVSNNKNPLESEVVQYEQKDKEAISAELQLESKDRQELEDKLAKSIPQIFSEAQQNLLKNETPRYVIKTRKGKGGQLWDYVDTGYIIEQLNILTGFRWNFKITSKLTVMEAKEVGEQVVTGILTVYGTGTFKDLSIEKEDCGSADLKKKTDGSGYLSYGNDLKAAISDCIKRCARQFGIALDVYSGAIKRRQDENHPEHPITEGQRKRLEVLAGDAGIGHSGLKKLVHEMHDYTSTTQVQRRHFDGLVQRLQLIAVESGPEPQIPDDIVDGFDILGTPKAKRIATWKSYSSKGDEGIKKLKADLSAEIDRRNIAAATKTE